MEDKGGTTREKTKRREKERCFVLGFWVFGFSQELCSREREKQKVETRIWFENNRLLPVFSMKRKLLLCVAVCARATVRRERARRRRRREANDAAKRGWELIRECLGAKILVVFG